MALYGYATRRKKQPRIVKHVTRMARLRKKNSATIGTGLQLPKFRKACPVVDVKCDADICW